MFMFLRIERPTSATLRSFAIATSAACCMRWMFDAKLATRIRPVRERDELPERLADEPLGAGHARALGVRRVAEHQVDAAVADLRELADVGLEAVDRRVVELPVAGVQARARPGVSITIATQSGIECAIRTNSSLNGPICIPSPSGSASRSVVDGAEAVLVELRLHHRERQLGADHLADLDLAQHVGQRADVVLVAVREDDREQRAVLRGTRSPAGRGRRRGARRAGTRARRRSRIRWPSNS